MKLTATFLSAILLLVTLPSICSSSRSKAQTHDHRLRRLCINSPVKMQILLRFPLLWLTTFFCGRSLFARKRARTRWVGCAR
jgi:hypothetical protein